MYDDVCKDFRKEKLLRSTYNYATLSLVVLFLLGGCTSTQQKPASKVMSQDLPKLHKKSEHDKALLLELKQCFKRVEDVKGANRCVKTYASQTDAFDLGTFKVWNKEMRLYTLENLDADIAFEECLIKTERFSDVLKCRKPLSVKPLLKE